MANPLRPPLALRCSVLHLLPAVDPGHGGIWGGYKGRHAGDGAATHRAYGSTSGSHERYAKDRHFSLYFFNDRASVPDKKVNLFQFLG